MLAGIWAIMKMYAAEAETSEKSGVVLDRLVAFCRSLHFSLLFAE